MSRFLLNLARRSAGAPNGAPSVTEISPVLAPEFHPMGEGWVEGGEGDAEFAAVEGRPPAEVAERTAAAQPVLPALAKRKPAAAESGSPGPRAVAHPPVELSPSVGPSTGDSPAEPAPEGSKSPDQGGSGAARFAAFEPPLAPRPDVISQAAKAVHPEPPPRALPPALEREPRPGSQADRRERSEASSAVKPPDTPKATLSEQSPPATSVPVRGQPAPDPPPGEPLPMVAPAPTAPPDIPLSQSATRETEARPVQVRIGRIEVRARTPAIPEASPPAPATRGFDRYARRRTYSREEY